MLEPRIDSEHQRSAEEQRLAPQEQRPTVDRVRHGPTPQGGQGQGHELGGSQQPNDGGRSRERIDLHRQRDVGEKTSERADELPSEQKAIVTMPAERREVDECGESHGRCLRFVSTFADRSFVTMG